MLTSLVDPADIAITQPNGHSVATGAFSGGAYICLQNKSNPCPSEYFEMHMCSAVSELSSLT